MPKASMLGPEDGTLIKPEASRRQVDRNVAQAGRRVAPVGMHVAQVDIHFVRDGMKQVAPADSRVIVRRDDTEDPCNPRIQAGTAAANCPYCFNTD